MEYNMSTSLEHIKTPINAETFLPIIIASHIADQMRVGVVNDYYY